tara:strand:- start:610 stop:771 length:162 start_codon:yes stop_codon:yes gene_type:complete
MGGGVRLGSTIKLSIRLVGFEGCFISTGFETEETGTGTRTGTGTGTGTATSLR